MKKIIFFIVVSVFLCLGYYNQVSKLSSTIKPIPPKPIPPPSVIDQKDFVILKKFLKEEYKNQEEILLRDYALDDDFEVKNTVSSYPQRKEALKDRIIELIGQGKFDTHFTQEDFFVALFFRPEIRTDFIDVFNKYITDIYGFTHDKGIDLLPLDIFFDHKLLPKDPERNTVFISYDLMKKYRIKCYFENTTTGQRTHKFWFAGSFYTSFQGFIEIELFLHENKWKIKKNKISFWKTRCSNIYDFLITPLEEALHFSVGPYTDKKIIQDMESADKVNAQKVLDKWITIEEALVGGMSYALLDEYLENRGLKIDESVRAEVFKVFSNYSLYSHRCAGVVLVKELGPKKALEIYQKDPDYFIRMLNEKIKK